MANFGNILERLVVEQLTDYPLNDHLTLATLVLDFPNLSSTTKPSIERLSNYFLKLLQYIVSFQTSWSVFEVSPKITFGSQTCNQTLDKFWCFMASSQAFLLQLLNPWLKDN